jgi:alpha-tubulin suppressor-like RCC1 family protein
MASRLHTRILCWGTVGSSLKATRPAELFLRGLPPRVDGRSWDFVAIAAGLKHFALLTALGEIVLVGNNRHGQIGQPSAGVDVNEVTPYMYDVGYEDHDRPDTVRCGCNYNIFFKRGTRHATVVGYNVYGQLGLGHKIVLNNAHGFAEWDPESPWWRPGEQIDDIVCGKNHTFVITSQRRILACGSNQWGELGINSTDSPMSPQPVGHFRGEGEAEPANVPKRSSRIRKVAAGNSFSLMLGESGHVYGCGSDEYGQLITRGFEPQLQLFQRDGSDNLLRIKDVGCGADFSCVVTNKDELFIRGGIPETGQLKGMHRVRQIEHHTDGFAPPVKHLFCGPTTAFVVDGRGAIHGFGNNAEGQLAVSEGRINTAPASFMTKTVRVIGEPAKQDTIDWFRHFAVGHNCAYLIDREEAYAAAAVAQPVVMPPEELAPKRRRLKF